MGRARTAYASPASEATSRFAPVRDPSASLRMTRLRASLPNHPLRFRGRRGLAALDHGQLGTADAEELPNFLFDLVREVRVLPDEQVRVLAALAEADVAVGEPRAGLLDDLVLDTDVEQLTGLRDALAVADVELSVTERCGDFVLDHLHLHARADDF